MAIIRYLGHASFLMELGGKTIISDPWFDEKPRELERLVPPAIKAEEVKKCDVILVSHAHFDHFSAYDIVTIAERTFATVVGTEEVISRIELNPRQKMPVNAGEEFDVLGINIKVVEAIHPQSRDAVGFVVRAGGKSVYFAGDTYEFNGMRNIEADCAIIPIGGTYTMDVLAAIKALKTMRTKFVVPMHYNTFQKIKCDVNDFVSRVKKDTRVIPVVLNPGESFTI